MIGDIVTSTILLELLFDARRHSRTRYRIERDQRWALGAEQRIAAAEAKRARRRARNLAVRYPSATADSG